MPELPIVDNSQGKTSCTEKLTAELINPTNEIAKPRIIFGNNSENITHITGPMDTANAATKPSIPINIKSELLWG